MVLVFRIHSNWKSGQEPSHGQQKNERQPFSMQHCCHSSQELLLVHNRFGHLLEPKPEDAADHKRQ